MYQNARLNCIKSEIDSMEDDKELSRVLHKNTVAEGHWRSQISGIKQKLKFLLDKGILSDITLLIGEDKVPIQSHKFMLSAASPILENLCKRPEIVFIQIKELTPSACHRLLKFIYTDDLDLDSLDDDEELIILALAAKKFQIDDLFSNCLKHLSGRIRDGNALQFLEKSQLLGSKSLELGALNFICRNAKRLVSSNDFLSLSWDALYALLSDDNIQVDELSLFRVSLKWAEAECLRQGLIPDPKNLRTVLGDAIYQFRFPLMSSEMFSLQVKGSGVLNPEEIIDIYTYISLKQSGQYHLLSTLSKTLKFSCKERRYTRSNKFAVCRFPRSGKEVSSWSYKGDFDRISFQVNRPITMLGFSIYGARDEARASYFIKFFLHELTSGKGDYLASNLITSKEMIVKQIRAGENIYILFKEPGINITENVWYTISALIQGPISNYGEDGREEIELNCGPSETVKFKFRGVKNSANGTFVEVGQFPEIVFRLR